MARDKRSPLKVKPVLVKVRIGNTTFWLDSFDAEVVRRMCWHFSAGAENEPIVSSAQVSGTGLTT